MRFVPKTELELQGITLLEPGVYPFQVTVATNEVSKSGNDMIKLAISVCDEYGNVHNIYDYLLEAMSFKLRHFCESTGMIDRYELGEIDARDCINKQGYVDLIIEEGKYKESGDRYPSRNAVKDYTVKSAHASRTAAYDGPF